MKYTEPKLNKGKKPMNIPKGSTLEKEWAKNSWYINYSYNGKQYRIKENLNRISDPGVKLKTAKLMIEALNLRFSKGYDPEKKEEYIKSHIRTELTIDEVVNEYLARIKKYARVKTVQSYQSKLRYLVEQFQGKTINSFSSTDIQNYIQDRINGNVPYRIFRDGKTLELNKDIRWTRNTVKAAKGVFRAFFNWCIFNGYYKNTNPMNLIDNNTITSDNEPLLRNKAFTQADNLSIMNYLDEHDPAVAFFCRVLYLTCLRPGELIKLKVRDFNLETRHITVPFGISKNRKSKTFERIYMFDDLVKLLNDHNMSSFDPNSFICTDSLEIFGSVPFGRDTPYRRFKKALKALNLTHKGYVLYSFKHFSNVCRMGNKWPLAKIMIGNRHSSIAMTEKYLQDLKNDSSLSDLTLPMI
jgi:integrase